MTNFDKRKRPKKKGERITRVTDAQLLFQNQ
jgi:hypothetical protein